MAASLANMYKIMHRTMYIGSVEGFASPVTNSGRWCRGSENQQGVEKGQSEAFDDVQLGPLLGQGGFGKVYRGLWNGAAVAVKVRPVMHRPACLLRYERVTCFCPVLYC